MKMILFLLVFALPSAVWAEGNSTGNGGGVICIKGVCKTLTEAGVEVKPDFPGVWIPSAQVVQNVRSKLRLNYSLHEDVIIALEFKILGKMDHFRKAEVVVPEKLEKIRELYIDAIRETGADFDPSTFRLVAFSSDNTVTPAMTYILPAFLQLTESQQADLLIHEGLYRGRPTSDLRAVLQLETATKDWESTYPERANSQISAYNLGFINKSQLLAHLLFVLSDHRQLGKSANKLDRNNRGLSIQRLGNLTADQTQAIITLDRLALIELGEVDARLPYIFSRIDNLKFQFIKSYDPENLRGTDISKYIYCGQTLGKCDFNTYLSLKSELKKVYLQVVEKNAQHTPVRIDIYELENPESLDLLIPR